jgi:hypothetical protein
MPAQGSLGRSPCQYLESRSLGSAAGDLEQARRRESKRRGPPGNVVGHSARYLASARSHITTPDQRLKDSSSSTRLAPPSLCYEYPTHSAQLMTYEAKLQPGGVENPKWPSGRTRAGSEMLHGIHEA